jgi:hypothetical protein
MVYDREQAAKRAEAATTNVPDTCQLWTRSMFGVPSVGDFDGDGAADAEDGWKSELTQHRHDGDRRPPRGVPVSYLGGSKDNGHRAVSLGPINGTWMIRSTDAGGSGHIATVPLNWPERVWGLQYVGWSETCDGVLIPVAEAPKPAVPEPAHPYVGKRRVAQFLEGGPAYDMQLLKVAAGHRADARRALDLIDAAVAQVPRGLIGSRANRFHVGYATGTLRLGLLDADAKRHARSGAAARAIRAALKDLRG